VFCPEYMHRFGSQCFGFLALLGLSVGEASTAFHATFLEGAQVAIRSRERARSLSSYLMMEDVKNGAEKTVPARGVSSMAWGLPCFHIQDTHQVLVLQPIDWLNVDPKILSLRDCAHPKTQSFPVHVYAYSRRFVDQLASLQQCQASKVLLFGHPRHHVPLSLRIAQGLAGTLSPIEFTRTNRDIRHKAQRLKGLATGEENPDKRAKLLHAAAEATTQAAAMTWASPTTQQGLVGDWLNVHSTSHLQLPSLEQLIHDSGKLTLMDRLLRKLKEDGHRVLIFCQMTKMIDILEDYMAFRKHTYVRLDGSSNLADRRDMVEDFQTRDDIFAFLLSTRAGGLGINLTAADTVIFYDNDWNPTQDAQAMDRTHRIGQTKQVTVYRLLTKGTVEERILKRAKAKQTIQKTVYSGQIAKDHFEAEEMLSMLVDEEEAERRGLVVSKTMPTLKTETGEGQQQPSAVPAQQERRRPGPQKRKGIFGMVGEKKDKPPGMADGVKKPRIDVAGLPAGGQLSSPTGITQQSASSPSKRPVVPLVGAKLLLGSRPITAQPGGSNLLVRPPTGAPRPGAPIAVQTRPPPPSAANVRARPPPPQGAPKNRGPGPALLQRPPPPAR